MEYVLRYIGISHNTASVKQREAFHIPEEDKAKFILRLKALFPDIKGLLLLATCNRTELYFESATTTTREVLEYFIKNASKAVADPCHSLFSRGDHTLHSVRHLVEVSTGLRSKVLGDAEIIFQIKKAYRISREIGAQGSLLERAMQTVFKSHKRVSNETHFRDGTTSAAYKALKTIETYFGKQEARHKKILIIGAGDIVKQLFKYVGKFDYDQIFVSNRTMEKASYLANKHGAETYPWVKVLKNEFEDFDVIIGAAGNCHHLVNAIDGKPRPILLIDLGLPSTINPLLTSKPEVSLYDLDTISSELENNRELRLRAISAVQGIAGEEVALFEKWYAERPLRKILAHYKINIRNQVEDFLPECDEFSCENLVELLTARVVRRIAKDPDKIYTNEQLNHLVKVEAYFAMEPDNGVNHKLSQS
ncbi:glutamyl-tRNA reductase [Muriicola soli]|uniref:glutamyl-tRNA reductase n=1 Tax=Muriicola soli TaxID=2507538 RepID=UPI0013EC7BD0|nr:hypothetical protein [Muriicola soli]